MKKPAHTLKAWKVDEGHVCVPVDYLGDRQMDWNDPLRAQSPIGLLFHTRAAALEATLAWLRATAEREPLAVALAPHVGPHYCDWAWMHANGKPEWDWRVHRLTIALYPEDEPEVVEVSATYDVQVCVQSAVPAYSRVTPESELVPHGFVHARVPVIPWAPWQAPDREADPGDPERRRLYVMRVDAKPVTLEWGDIAPASDAEEQAFRYGMEEGFALGAVDYPPDELTDDAVERAFATWRRR